MKKFLCVCIKDHAAADWREAEPQCLRRRYGGGVVDDVERDWRDST